MYKEVFKAVDEALHNKELIIEMLREREDKLNDEITELKAENMDLKERLASSEKKTDVFKAIE